MWDGEQLLGFDMKNYGIFSRELRTYPLPDGGRSQPVWVLIDDEGRDVLLDIEKNPSPFYIAVLEDGSIFSMWDDISHMQIPGVQIIGIDEDFGYAWGEGGNVFGKIWNGTAIVEPDQEPEPIPDEISRRQFFQYLAVLEIITRQEALAALQSGAIPSPLQAIIDQLPSEDDRFEAQMFIIGAQNFNRLHPLSETVRLSLGWSIEQKDDFWREAYKL